MSGKRKLTMTPKWRESLVRARAAREAKAAERGSRYTADGMERMRELGRRNAASWEASRERRRAMDKTASDDADALVIQLFQLMNERRKTYAEVARKAGLNPRSLVDWKACKSTPTLTRFREVAWALGYVVKLEPFDQPKPRDVSTWQAPRDHFNAPRTGKDFP